MDFARRWAMSFWIRSEREDKTDDWVSFKKSHERSTGKLGFVNPDNVISSSTLKYLQAGMDTKVGRNKKQG